MDDSSCCSCLWSSIYTRTRAFSKQIRLNTKRAVNFHPLQRSDDALFNSVNHLGKQIREKTYQEGIWVYFDPRPRVTWVGRQPHIVNWWGCVVTTEDSKVAVLHCPLAKSESRIRVAETSYICTIRLTWRDVISSDNNSGKRYLCVEALRALWHMPWSCPSLLRHEA